MIFTISEYKDCLSFGDSFKTLKHLEPSKDENGEYVFSSGRNSVVFKMVDKQTNGFKALKCFINVNKDQLEYIRQVSEYLQYIKSSYIVPYQYFEQELWMVSSYEEPQYYPILLMDWVEGKIMGQYLNELCEAYDYVKIKDLALAFDQMALWLLHQDFAHGDLKLDNIIVNKRGLPILIDYDGCFIPGMEDTNAQELGTPGYQHPKRDVHFFNKSIDDVGILVISTALHALVTNSELWAMYNNGENLLFTATDLDCYQDSLLWEQLIKLDHELVNQRLALLQYGLEIKTSIHGLESVLKLSKSVILFYEKKLVQFIDDGIFVKSDIFDNSFCFERERREISFYYDKNDKFLFDKYFDYAQCFFNGIAIVGSKYIGEYDDKYEDYCYDIKFGLINNMGQIILSLTYDDILYYYNNGGDGFIVSINLRHDTEKNWFKRRFKHFSLYSKEIEDFYNEELNRDFVIALKSGEKIVFDKNGNRVSKFKNNIKSEYITSCKNPSTNIEKSKLVIDLLKFKNALNYIENAELNEVKYELVLALNCKLFIVKSESKYGIINNKGRFVFPIEYEKIYHLRNGLIVVCKSKKIGFVNTFGCLITPIKYDDFITIEKTKINYVDWNNYNWELELKLKDTIRNEIIVIKENKYGIINQYGQEITPIIYDKIYDKYWINSKIIFSAYLNGKYGAIDLYGNVIIPFEFMMKDQIFGFYEGVSVVEKDGKFGVYDENGNIVIPIIQNYITPTFRNGNAIFVNKNNIGLIDKQGKTKLIFNINDDDDDLYFKGDVIVYKAWYPKSNSYTLYDYSGKQLETAPINELYFENDVFWIRSEEKYGLLDRKGIAITSVDFDEYSKFNLNYAKVSISGKFGYIDNKGTQILPIIYDSIFESNDDDIEIVEINNKFGIINRYNKTLLTEVKYDKILPFQTNNTNDVYKSKYFNKEGFAAVQINDKFGFVDLNGKELTSVKYDHIICSIEYESGGSSGYSEWNRDYYDNTYSYTTYTYYFDNRFCGEIDDEKVFVDIKGREIFGYDNCCFLENGFVLVNIGAEFSMIYYESDYDPYSTIERKTDTVIPTFKGGKWGVLNKDNEIIIPIIYDKIELLIDIFFKVELSKMFGIYSDNGNVIIEAKHDEILILDKHFIVKLDGKYGIISKIGIIIIPLIYDTIKKLNDLFIVFNGNKWGGFDENGCTVIPLIYDSISNIDELFIVELNNLYGCLNIEGVIVIPIEYAIIYHFNNTYIQASQDEKYWLIDKTGNKITEFERKVYFISEDENFIIIENTKSYAYRKYGILNKKGELLTNCIYSKIDKRDDGNYLVNIGGHINRDANFDGGKWGVIDIKGEIITPIEFDYLS